MRLLYTIAIGCYGLGLRLAALLGHKKARRMADGWRLWPTRLDRLGPHPVWFHASSLGEFEQARPLIEAYRKRHPGQPVLLTFFSPSGYEVRNTYAQADAVCYLPLDTPRRVGRFLAAVQPAAAFFVKYDFWFNYLHQLQRAGVPVYLFSAIFRPGQYFFKPWGGWFRRQLAQCYTHIFVQNEESLRLLKAHGIDRCSIAGDTRHDRVHQIVAAAERNEVVERWLAATAPQAERPRDGRVVVAGSSWPPDEDLLARFAQESPCPMRLVIAPHVVGEEHLARIAQLFPRSIRYSAVAAGQSPEGRPTLVIDNIGMLAQLYRYADVAYIGGGFGAGIHNILEAVAWGKPVIFGPNYGKFKEARDIIALGGGWSVASASDLTRTLAPLIADPAKTDAPSRICTEYIQAGIGSTEKILRTIEK